MITHKIGSIRIISYDILYALYNRHKRHANTSSTRLAPYYDANTLTIDIPKYKNLIFVSEVQSLDSQTFYTQLKLLTQLYSAPTMFDNLVQGRY